MLSAVPQRATESPRFRPLSLLGGVGAAAVVAATVPSVTNLVPPCPLHATTGLDCPGCGATRGVMAAVRGDLPAAIGHNALLFVVALPLLTALWLSWYRVRVHDRPWPSWTRKPVVWQAWLVVAIAFGIVRNLPWGPLAALAA